MAPGGPLQGGGLAPPQPPPGAVVLPSPAGGAPTLPPRASERADGASPRIAVGRHADQWGDGEAPVVLGRSRALPVPEPVPVRSAEWARWMYVVAVVVCGPAQLLAQAAVLGTDDEIGWSQRAALVAPSLVLVLVLAIWTGANLDNCRRLLAHSRFADSVSPWRGVLWWAALPGLGIPLIAVTAIVRERFIISSDRFGRDADVASAFLVFGSVLVLFAIWVRPYLYLTRAMGRIRGDVSLFRRWIWMPIVATMLVVAAIIGLSLFGSLQSGATRGGVAIVIVMLTIVPYLVWCLTGWRAMSTMALTVSARAVRQREQRAEYLQLQRVEELAS